MDDLFKASKSQLKQMFKPEQQAEHAPVIDWAAKTFKNQSHASWFINHYKKNPSEALKYQKDFNNLAEQAKELPEIHNTEIPKTHSLQEGVDALKSQSDSEIGRKKLLEPRKETRKMIDLGNGWGWYNLHSKSCADEGGSMGHCGNTAQPSEGDTVLSLRKKIKIGDKVYHEPHATFILNDGVLGEMKGRANEKPNQKYHPAIMSLLKHPTVQALDSENAGGEPHKNFHLDDLKPEQKEQILKEKPTLDILYKNPQGQPEFKDLLNVNHPYIYQEIAKNPEIFNHPDKLNEISLKSKYAIRALAKHPEIFNHPEVLDRVIRGDEYTQEALAAYNPDTFKHPNIVERLSEGDFSAQSALAKRPELWQNKGLLNELANTYNLNFQERLAEHPEIFNHPEIVNILAGGNEYSQRVLAEHPEILNHPEAANKLAEGNPFSQSALARHPEIFKHPDIVNKLVEGHEYAQEALARHPNLTQEIYDKLKQNPNRYVQSSLNNRSEFKKSENQDMKSKIKQLWQDCVKAADNHFDVARDFFKSEMKKMLQLSHSAPVGGGALVKDKIPGGLADDKKPEDFDPEALKEGIKVEMEHTSDESIAQEIAMDHLTEDKEYYKKLKTIEKSNYGPQGSYSQEHNVRRKQENAEDSAPLGNIKQKVGSQGKQQIDKEVKEAKEKSKQNPVRTPEDSKTLMGRFRLGQNQPIPKKQYTFEQPKPLLNKLLQPKPVKSKPVKKPRK